MSMIVGLFWIPVCLRECILRQCQERTDAAGLARIRLVCATAACCECTRSVRKAGWQTGHTVSITQCGVDATDAGRRTAASRGQRGSDGGAELSRGAVCVTRCHGGVSDRVNARFGAGRGATCARRRSRRTGARRGAEPGLVRSSGADCTQTRRGDKGVGRRQEIHRDRASASHEIHRDCASATYTGRMPRTWRRA